MYRNGHMVLMKGPPVYGNSPIVPMSFWLTRKAALQVAARVEGARPSREAAVFSEVRNHARNNSSSNNNNNNNNSSINVRYTSKTWPVLTAGISGCVYSYTYIYIYVYNIQLYVCTYVCMYACMHACMHVCMYAPLYTYMFVQYNLMSCNLM